MKEIKIISAIGILFLGFVIFLLWPDEEKIIQAAPIVVLVFVTLYYAIETHKIMGEGRIKRIADFHEKRINEFYLPFIKNLNDLIDELHNTPPNTKRMNELRSTTKYFLWQKAYMVSKETMKKITDLEFDLLIADLDREKDAYRKLRESEQTVRKIINEEWAYLEGEIRKVYGYSEGEK
jgi:hypothetical protein